MIRWIVGSSLRYRRLVLAVAVVLLGLGIAQLPAMPVEALPDFGPVQVEVQSEALGLSAEEVENLITNPMEQEFFNGMPWLAAIRSDSLPGLSRMDLVFEPGTDPIRARQVVQERLTMVRALPAVSKSPAVIQPTSTTSRLMMIGLSSQDVSLIDMSVLARFNIRQRLIAVPGVANGAGWGLRDRQLQVLFDPAKLRQANVPLDDVITSAANSMWSSPLTFVEASTPGTGGFVENANQRIEIQHKQPVKTAADLAQVALETPDKKGLRLGDVASLVEDHPLLIGDGLANAQPSLLMVVERFPGTSVSQLTKDVEEALDRLRPSLTGITVDSTLYRPASYLDNVRGNLGWWLFVGLILLAVVLGAMLLSWRAVLAALLSITLSVVVAALVLAWFGIMLNAMIVAGLVMALAIVVDDAVSDVVNGRRRLREPQPALNPRDVVGAGPAEQSDPADQSDPAEQSDPAGRFGRVLAAALEMRSGLAVATLIAVLSVVPVLAIGEVTGTMLRQVALGYVVAILASTVVALTVTPALALLLLGGRSERSAARQSPVARVLVRAHGSALSRLVRRPLVPVAAAGVLLIAGLAVVPVLGSPAVAPPLQARDLLVTWQGPAGISLPEMSRLTAQASRQVRAVPGVRSVGTHVGRALLSDEVVGANSAEMWVAIGSPADYAATTKAVREVVEGFPGLRTDVTTYPEQRLRAVQTGSAAELVVRVYGRDYDVLRDKAHEVADIVAGVEGVAQPRVSMPDFEPTVEVEVDIPKAAAAGLKPGEARRAAATIASGSTVGHMYEGQKSFEVTVWSAPENRRSLSSVQNLMIDSPVGGQVRLGDIASVRVRPNPTNIKHDAVARYVDVTAEVRGRSLGAVTSEVTDKVRTVTFPTEHHLEVLGESVQRQSAAQQTLAYAIAFLIVLFFLLQAAFGSWRLASLLFLLLPPALVGGVVMAALLRDLMSGAALMGLVAVLAVAVRGGIVLIRHYQRLEGEGVAPGPDVVLRGTRERFAAVVTAALAAAAALAPLLVVLGSGAGLEILQPLVAIVLGGLVTSTLVILFVLPAVYLRFGTRLQPATAGSRNVETE